MEAQRADGEKNRFTQRQTQSDRKKTIEKCFTDQALSHTSHLCNNRNKAPSSWSFFQEPTK